MVKMTAEVIPSNVEVDVVGKRNMYLATKWYRSSGLLDKTGEIQGLIGSPRGLGMPSSVQGTRGFCLLPGLLPSKALVEKSKNLGDVELDVFQVKVVLVVFLHLKEIVELEIEFQEAPISS